MFNEHSSSVNTVTSWQLLNLIGFFLVHTLSTFSIQYCFYQLNDFISWTEHIWFMFECKVTSKLKISWNAKLNNKKKIQISSNKMRSSMYCLIQKKPTNTRNISHDQKCRILLLLSFVLISLYIRTHLSFKALTVCAYKYNWAMSPSIVCVWFQKWCVFYERKKRKFIKFIHILLELFALYSWYS